MSDVSVFEFRKDIFGNEYMFLRRSWLYTILACMYMYVPLYVCVWRVYAMYHANTRFEPRERIGDCNTSGPQPQWYIFKLFLFERTVRKRLPRTQAPPRERQIGRSAGSYHSNRVQQHMDTRRRQPRQQRWNGDDVDPFRLLLAFTLDQLAGISELCVCDSSSKWHSDRGTSLVRALCFLCTIQSQYNFNNILIAILQIIFVSRGKSFTNILNSLNVVKIL